MQSPKFIYTIYICLLKKLLKKYTQIYLFPYINIFFLTKWHNVTQKLWSYNKQKKAQKMMAKILYNTDSCNQQQ